MKLGHAAGEDRKRKNCAEKHGSTLRLWPLSASREEFCKSCHRSGVFPLCHLVCVWIVLLEARVPQAVVKQRYAPSRIGVYSCGSDLADLLLPHNQQTNHDWIDLSPVCRVSGNGTFWISTEELPLDTIACCWHRSEGVNWCMSPALRRFRATTFPHLSVRARGRRVGFPRECQALMAFPQDTEDAAVDGARRRDSVSHDLE